MAKRGRKKANDNKGYLDSNKDKFTDYKVIDGNKITMRGVSGKIYAIPVDKNGNAGKGRLMSPNEEHTFEGANQVIEIPEASMRKLQGGGEGEPNRHGTTNPYWKFVEGVGGFVGDTVDGMHEALGGLDYAFLNPDSKNFIGKWGTPSANAAENPNTEPEWTGGVGNFTLGDNGASLVPNLGDKGVLEQYPVEPSKGLERSIFESHPVENKKETPSFDTDFGGADINYDPLNPSLTKKEHRSNRATQFGDVGNPNDDTQENTEDDVNNKDEETDIEQTKKIQFNNLYGGVDLTSASNILGKSLGYDGDKKGANTARGVASGLKLLAGLGRNIMSGYGQEKRNQFMTDEYNKRTKNSLKKTTSLQRGGEVDGDEIRESTDIDFNDETISRLFERVAPQEEAKAPEIKFGKYDDVGYFETGEMVNGKRIVYNTDKNPYNYDDNRRNALDYLRELNGDNFEFRYRTPNQRMQKGGNVDNDEIREATDIDFNDETISRLFERVTPKEEPTTPEIKFGKYDDVGYFEAGEMVNGKRVIYNTANNPYNYDDNRRNALDYLRKLNGDNFEFRYRKPSSFRNKKKAESEPIASLKKGGNTPKPNDMLTGAYTTGTDAPDANVEVEKGEHILNHETGKVQEVIGKKHSQGGEKMRLDGQVLSDYNKIGGDLAKKYRDEFDIKIKAKDTFATAFDKVLKKTGYTSLTKEMGEYIDKTEKVQENAQEGDDSTTGLNMQFLSGKINEIDKQLKPLEELKTQVFSTMFEDQQGAKSAKELAEEGSGDLPEAKRGMKVDPDYYKKLVGAESSGDPNAKASTSTASGVHQFTEGTWKDMVDELGLDYTLEDRFDPEKSQIVVEAFTEKNEKILEKELGRKPTSSELYLAHFLGAGGAQKALKAMKENPEMKIEDVVAAKSISSNPNVFKDMENVGDLYEWSNSKFGIEGRELPPVPEELKRQTDAGRLPYQEGQDMVRDDFNSDQPLTNVDGTPYQEGDDITKTKEFRTWFHNNRITNQLTPNGRIESPEQLTEIIANHPDLEYITREFKKETSKENSEEGKSEKEKGNTEYQTPLLPDQTPLPPSTLQIGSLQEVTPREAEAQLQSADAQIEEINRQFLTAKKSLDSLPASERVAALAKLNAQTQQSINKVMSQTNAVNSQIKNQTEQFNAQAKSQADRINANAKSKFETEAFMAMDNTNSEVRNWFNRISENRMGNYLTVQEMNLMNQGASDYQYNANGEVEQTGKAYSADDIERIARMYQNMSPEAKAEVEKAKKAKKRGRNKQ